jgi:hypothetical protein
MATLSFSFETTDAGKTRIRHALARQRGFVGDLNDPAKQTEIDTKAKEYFHGWLLSTVEKIEAIEREKETEVETEAANVPLPLN